LNLTQDYKKIWATFDYPIKHTREPAPISPGQQIHKTYFEVGPFEYALTIRRDSEHPQEFTVSFSLFDVNIPLGKTVGEVFSEFLGEPISGDEARKVYTEMVDNPYKIYNFKKISFRVLSAIVQSVRKYFSQVDYQCISFTSYEESRTDLYRRMVSRFFPGHQVSEGNFYDQDFLGEGTTNFKICKPGVVS
jgi:hypothetical protein